MARSSVARNMGHDCFDEPEVVRLPEILRLAVSGIVVQTRPTWVEVGLKPFPTQEKKEKKKKWEVRASVLLPPVLVMDSHYHSSWVAGKYIAKYFAVLQTFAVRFVLLVVLEEDGLKKINQSIEFN